MKRRRKMLSNNWYHGPCHGSAGIAVKPERGRRDPRKYIGWIVLAAYSLLLILGISLAPREHAWKYR
jgi:hypothetical protein